MNILTSRARNNFIGASLATLLFGGHLRAQQSVVYEGSFLNTTVNLGGTLDLTMTVWPGDSLSGTANFTEYPGGAPLCAAGEFTGHLLADSVFVSFVSQDLDPGCGFDHGVLIGLAGRLVNGLDSVSGSYSYGTVQAGIYWLGYVSSTNVVDTPTGSRTTRIFPVPTDRLVTIEHPGSVVAVRVLRPEGLLALLPRVHGPQGPLRIDLGELPPGLYLLELRFADGTRAVERVVKQ
ncbi:MAG TPA: hypothetical protein PKE21_11180 [Flavobacteriales bacterium]|nr:hypothetical protein [Flavobacteriales bacterium]HMR28032.1 hypothetical protein [Flavobacteriales bacterium]